MTVTDIGRGIDTLWYTRCPVPTASSVAISEGWLDREFAPDGIAVRSLRDSADAARRLDHYTHGHPALLREGGIVPPLVSRARGTRLRLIALAGVDQFHGVVALPGSGIRDAQDLAGRRVAIPRRLGQPVDFPRPLALYYLNEALRRAGLAESDVRLVDVVSDEPFLTAGAPSRTGSLYTARENVRLQSAEVLALVRGEVDAIVTSGGHGRAICALIGACTVIDLSNPDPARWRPNHLRVLTVSEELLQGRPDLVVRYLTALLAAARWSTAHPGEARRIVAAEEGLAEEWVSAGYHPDLTAHLGLGLDEQALAALQDRARFFHDRGFLGTPVEIDRWVSPEPLRAALAAAPSAPSAPSAPDALTAKPPTPTSQIAEERYR